MARSKTAAPSPELERAFAVLMKPRRKCVVCGCTENRACYGGCGWDPRYEEVCDRCTSDTPYRAVSATPGNGGRARWFVVGPGDHPLAMPPIPRTLKRPQAEQLALAFNYAFRLGLGLGLTRAIEAQKGMVR